MCFVWISEQTAIISLYSIHWLVFIQCLLRGADWMLYYGFGKSFPPSIFIHVVLLPGQKGGAWEPAEKQYFGEYFHIFSSLKG